MSNLYFSCIEDFDLLFLTFHFNINETFDPKFNKMNAVEFKSLIEGINQRH